jgi:hypothetical protein
MVSYQDRSLTLWLHHNKKVTGLLGLLGLLELLGLLGLIGFIGFVFLGLVFGAGCALRVTGCELFR